MPLFGGQVTGGRYLFIDGQYLESAYKEMMDDFFGVPGELDVSQISSGFQRVYYYHALEDELRPGESQGDMEKRVAADMDRFDEIASFPLFHVRLGSVTGRSVRRRRQKQVDVQLAVDVLSHAFHQNMTHAALIAGDLDFRPVIEALVSLGVATEVMFEKRSAAKPLYRSADFATELTLPQMYGWSTPAFRTAHSMPSAAWNSAPPHQNACTVVKIGTWGDRAVELLERTSGTGKTLVTIHAPADAHRRSFYVTYSDLAKLEHYFARYHGTIQWQ